MCTMRLISYLFCRPSVPPYQTSVAWAQSQAQALQSLSPELLSHALLSTLQQQNKQPQVQHAHRAKQNQTPFNYGSRAPVAPILAQLAQLQTNLGSHSAGRGSIMNANPAASSAGQAPARRASPLGDATPSSAPLPPTKKQPSSPRSKEERDAGTMLFGFLSALRKGHEEAVAKAAQSSNETSNASSSSSSDSSKPTSDNKTSSSKEKRNEVPKAVTFRPVSSPTDQPTSHALPSSSTKETSSESTTSPPLSEPSVAIKEIAPNQTLPNKQYPDRYSIPPPASVTDTSSGSSSAKTLDTSSSSAADSEKNESSNDSESTGSSENITTPSNGDGSDSNNETSSDGDEKDTNKATCAAASSEPPKKKHKKKTRVGEFTSQNVADHNTRMDAIYQDKMTTMSPASSLTEKKQSDQ